MRSTIKIDHKPFNWVWHQHYIKDFKDIVDAAEHVAQWSHQDFELMIQHDLKEDMAVIVMEAKKPWTMISGKGETFEKACKNFIRFCTLAKNRLIREWLRRKHGRKAKKKQKARSIRGKGRRGKSPTRKRRS